MTACGNIRGTAKYTAKAAKDALRYRESILCIRLKKSPRV